jgi:hypothetical protein
VWVLQGATADSWSEASADTGQSGFVSVAGELSAEDGLLRVAIICACVATSP